MIDLSIRSTREELLDQPNIKAADLHQNLKELDTINRLLGGHKATFNGLKRIIVRNKNKVWRIIDLGCGGGDTLRAIADWAKKKGVKVELTGVDLLEEAINYAENASRDYQINFLCSDFKDVDDNNYDIALSSLVCHHMYNGQLQNLLQTKVRIAQYGLINDLHRHFLAYYSIKWLTKLFSKSYLVKNDACLSVARAFTKTELAKTLKEAEVSVQEIKWIWAFRWMVIFKS